MEVRHWTRLDEAKRLGWGEAENIGHTNIAGPEMDRLPGLGSAPGHLDGKLRQMGGWALGWG